MKAVRYLFVCFFIPIIVSSCKKDHELSITGKWIESEVFYGFGKWQTIEDQYKRTIEFTSDGYYIEGPVSGSCNGTYTVTNQDINFTSSCGSHSGSFYFEYLPNRLIISYFFRDLMIKVKYSRVN